MPSPGVVSVPVVSAAGERGGRQNPFQARAEFCFCFVAACGEDLPFPTEVHTGFVQGGPPTPPPMAFGDTAGVGEDLLELGQALALSATASGVRYQPLTPSRLGNS